MKLFAKKRIYLDHAAATPIDTSVQKIITEYNKKHFGNPGSIHKEGVEAKRALEDARKKLADFFACSAEEIVFTSGGTESNNLAIGGFFNYLSAKPDRAEVFSNSRADLCQPLAGLHAITSKIEHPSVLDVFMELEKKGLDVTYIGVDENGVVSTEELKEAIKENTVFVSIMYANNETGVIQPIREIAKIIREHNKHLEAGVSNTVFHTDASQALNYLETDVRKLHVDLLSASGSKIYAPKGVGILYKKRNLSMGAIIHGGKQEHALRAGTENVAGILACGMAVGIVKDTKEKESVRMKELREYFSARIEKEFPEAVFNGGGEILPNIINVSFPGFESEELILRLDAMGVALAARSACKSDNDASDVIAILGEKHYPESAIRFSMGRSTTKKDLDYVIKCLCKILK